MCGAIDYDSGTYSASIGTHDMSLNGNWVPPGTPGDTCVGPPACVFAPYGGPASVLPYRVNLAYFTRGPQFGDEFGAYVITDLDPDTGRKRLLIGYHNLYLINGERWSEKYDGGIDPSMHLIAGSIAVDCRQTIWIGALAINSTHLYYGMAYKLRTDGSMRPLVRMADPIAIMTTPNMALTSIITGSDAEDNPRSAWMAGMLSSGISVYRARVANETWTTTYVATDSCSQTTTCNQTWSLGTVTTCPLAWL